MWKCTFFSQIWSLLLVLYIITISILTYLKERTQDQEKETLASASMINASDNLPVAEQESESLNPHHPR